MTKIGMFPGQGSQAVGMGRELYEKNSLARELFAEADEALGFRLSAICFEGPVERLKATEISQPAILTVSVICYRLAAAAHPELSLCAAAGHSLGEYSALVAAGALEFEDAVVLVNKRGRFMQKAVPAGEGKMIAILGLEIDAVEAATSKVASGIAQIANLNAPGQIVIAGTVAAVDELMGYLGKVRSVELPVSAPFHCDLMKPAELQLAEELNKTKFSLCKFPVYCNYSARPVRTQEEIKEALIKQVCSRVRWVECMINAVKDCGADAAVEFGSGGVLAGLLKRINPAITRIAAESPESIEALPV